VCFFSQGKIIEQGPPQQVFGTPRHERTQSFLRAVLEAS
jgi:polar amino acid transport system ATP-binding protein